MSAITLTDDALTIRLTRRDRVLWLRHQSIPLASVVHAEVVDDALGAVHEIRGPGLGLPGRRMLGTWRGRGATRLVDVRRGQPAVRVALRGHHVDELLLGTDDARRRADRLSRR